MVVTQTVTGPTRSPRLAGLSSVAEFEISDRLGYTETISWISDPCTFPKDAIGLCFESPDPVADAKSGEGVDIEEAISAPFAMYGGVECFLGPDNDFDERARLILDQGLDRFIEGRLAIWGAAIDPLSATDLVDALAQVEETLDAEYLGRGVILVNRGDAVRLSDALDASSDNVITTVNGTVVVSTAAVPAGKIIGTGAIKVLQTPIIAHNVIAHTTNVEFSIAERVNAILVDCSYRVLATVTP